MKVLHPKHQITPILFEGPFYMLKRTLDSFLICYMYVKHLTCVDICSLTLDVFVQISQTQDLDEYQSEHLKSQSGSKLTF